MLGAIGGTALGIGGALGGAALGASGARKQIAQMKGAIDYQKQKDTQNQQNFSPYVNFGTDQLNKFGSWLNSDASDPSKFLDPGYQFRQNQGMKTLTSNAATAGMLQSGDTLRAATDLGQGMASQEYANAFGRRMQEGDFQRANAGVGMQASGALGNLENQGAANVGSLTAGTDFGAPDRIWGDAVAGIGGMGGNSFARGMGGMSTLAGGGGGGGGGTPMNPNGMKWPF